MSLYLKPPTVCLALLLASHSLLAVKASPRQAKKAAPPLASSGMYAGQGLLFNGWRVTPSGTPVAISDMPLKMAVSPDGHTLAAVSGGFNAHGLSLISIADRRVSQFVPLQRAWNGLAFSKDGKKLFVAGGNSGEINTFDYADGKVTPASSTKPAPEEGAAFLAGMAVHPTTGKLYVCNEADYVVWVVDPDTLKREASVIVGPHPHSCVFGADGRHLYVSNWGGRSVSVIDTTTNRKVREMNVGVRPNDMALSPDGRLFVACSGDNTIHVIQTRALETPEAPASPTRRLPEGVREILSTSLYPLAPEGSTPDGVAVSPDGKMLYVANADNNDVMVADISNRDTTHILGFIPTGWYPTAVAVSPDSGTLFVANGKGLHSGPNAKSDTARTARSRTAPHFTYIGNLLEGSISFISRPDAATLEAYTRQVQQNTPSPAAKTTARSSIIPTGPGQSCPIKYILYIIKENRTYDQLFGDIPAGNGDPGLVMYGEGVTPNHHELARQYALLDNLYCNGEVSVDGHSWCDAAIATDYNERSWILSYSKHGSLPGNKEMEDPTAGYFWNLCQRQGVSYKCYGEGAGQVPTLNRGTWPGGRDMNRVEGWISDLKAAETTADLPHFMIMSLGEDHTKGTTPGAPTPEASVASNDIGVGKIVQAATRSRFWPQMAIFIIEDDAQNGPDHVDAHRTAGLVISPYVTPGIVDRTFYTTASMVRTMELILGLPPLTQYDAAATPMYGCFQNKPRLALYNLQNPSVDVNAINGNRAVGARESMRMDFDEYDKAPEDELNRILWAAAKGSNVPYPAPHHGALLTRYEGISVR